MPWVVAAAGVSAAAAIGGGIMSSNASKAASSAQQNSLREGRDFVQNMYETTRSDAQPWMQGGQSALGSLLGLYGLPGGDAGGANASFQKFQQTPYYQFPLQQGNLALSRQLAASGLTGSGAALHDASKLNTGFASQGFGNYISGLSGLSEQGRMTGLDVGRIGTQTAGQSLSASKDIGSAGAAGIVGSNNAMNQGFQNAMPYITGGPGNSGGNPAGNNGQSSYGSPNGGLIGQLGKLFSSGSGTDGGSGYIDSGSWGS